MPSRHNALEDVVRRSLEASASKRGRGDYSEGRAHVSRTRYESDSGEDYEGDNRRNLLASPMARKRQSGPGFSAPRRGSQPKEASATLRELLQLPSAPTPLTNEQNAALIIIDAQNTYTKGVMKLEGVDAALRECAALLAVARKNSVPIFHIQHDAGKGSPYDIEDEIGAICPIVAPKADNEKEVVIVKKQTSSFVDTPLEEKLRAAGVKNLIICGFMAHCCVSSTTRDAAHKGFGCNVVADATATRTLPDPSFFTSRRFQSAKSAAHATSADDLKRGTMTALADAFAVVVPAAEDIPSS